MVLQEDRLPPLQTLNVALLPVFVGLCFGSG